MQIEKPVFIGIVIINLDIGFIKNYQNIIKRNI